MHEVAGSNPAVSTNRNRTFVGRQMFCFCLSKPQAWYIITAQRAVHIISPSGCISSRASVHLSAAWWYTILRIDDIPQQVADDIQGCALIYLRKYGIICVKVRCFFVGIEGFERERRGPAGVARQKRIAFMPPRRRKARSPRSEPASDAGRLCDGRGISNLYSFFQKLLT